MTDPLTRGSVFNFFQIVIKSKGKICLAAAEVNDTESMVLRQIFKHVVDNFQISVYLTIFAVGARKTLPSSPITPSSMRKSQGIPSGII